LTSSLTITVLKEHIPSYMTYIKGEDLPQKEAINLKYT